MTAYCFQCEWEMPVKYSDGVYCCATCGLRHDLEKPNIVEPNQMNMMTTTCPYCAEIINVAAIKCKHCGERLDTKAPGQPAQKVEVRYPRQKKWEPGLAAVLSLFIPGAGQMYKGDVGMGVLWLIFTFIGYFFFVIPGLILHLICVILAASGDPYR